MSDSALRADSSQWSPQAPRINQATSMRCSARMSLQISVYTWLPQDTCIQISLYRWMLRVWCDLTRVKLWRLWQDRDYYVSHILVILIAFKVHHTHGHILESSWNPEVLCCAEVSLGFLSGPCFQISTRRDSNEIPTAAAAMTAPRAVSSSC